MTEQARYKLISRRKFAIHQVRNLTIGFFMIMLALWVGMYGYHHFEKMSWIDAFVNAAMILSGMGPMGNLTTDGGKIFAGVYALFSGLLFILIIGIIFAPLVHRFYKKINVQDES